MCTMHYDVFQQFLEEKKTNKQKPKKKPEKHRSCHSFVIRSQMRLKVHSFYAQHDD